jgi:hypothetical protein
MRNKIGDFGVGNSNDLIGPCTAKFIEWDASTWASSLRHHGSGRRIVAPIVAFAGRVPVAGPNLSCQNLSPINPF